jgi:site-specific DNA recombinase
VFVHTLDRWSRNVMVTLQTFRILSQKQTAFLSLSEHIDYSNPEGRLQLTILAAFAAYFSDMLSKHTTKGKGERAAQGLHNGDVPFGYRSTGAKTPLEHDPKNFAGLRLIGALSIQGQTAEQIADALNAAGYRTGSKRFKDRLFNKDTIAGILRNEFYCAFAPGDDRGTIRYQGQRHRGVHEAAFSVEEWEQVRSGLGMNVQAPHRAESAKKVYEFAGFIADIHCGLPLRCGGSGDGRNMYYRDVAKLRQLPCPVGGSLLVRVDVAREQFGEFLKGFLLPSHWQEEVHSRLLENLEKAGSESHNPARERERLKQKRNRILKQHRDGYISDKELRTEMAAVDLALSNVTVPDAEGITLDAIIEAGERLPSIASLWNVAKPEERREMVMVLLEPGGLYYDLEEKLIAAIKPRPVFLPILRLMTGLEEYSEAYGTLVTSVWRQRNRRA